MKRHGGLGCPHAWRGDDNRICHDDVSLHGAPSTAVAKGGAWRCFLVDSQDGVLFTGVIMMNGRTKALAFKLGGGSRHLSVGRSGGQKSYGSTLKMDKLRKDRRAARTVAM